MLNRVLEDQLARARRISRRIGARLNVIFAPARDAGEVFEEIYSTNYWVVKESVSGVGSEGEQVQELIQRLPDLLRAYDVRSMLDLPCGDFNWMQQVDLSGIDYLGADIVGEVVQRNRKEYTATGRNFEKLDLIKDPLPTADLLLCRDCLVHLSFRDIFTALENFCNSELRYLLTTTFINREKNKDIVTGSWRPLNLQRPPFNLPEPLELLDEKCTEIDGNFADKSLALWEKRDLCDALSKNSYWKRRRFARKIGIG